MLQVRVSSRLRVGSVPHLHARNQPQQLHLGSSSSAIAAAAAAAFHSLQHSQTHKQAAAAYTRPLPSSLQHARLRSLYPCPPLPSVSSAWPLQTPHRAFREYSASKLKATKKRSPKGEVSIPDYVTGDHLAHLLKRPLREVVKAAARLFPWWPELTERSMKKEAFATAKDTVLALEDSAKIASHFKRRAVRRDLSDRDWHESRPFGPPRLVQRPPVVAIMGHKDHGKTTLLDKLRGGNVAAKEEYGITQETYAFNVDIVPPPDVPLKHLLTIPAPTASKSSSSSTPSSSSSAAASSVRLPFSFLDTPGHVSFSEMRHNVGSVCDVILLVVAADEGVLDQTFESLRLARNLDKPLVVVINKMDLPQAKERAKAIREELESMGAKIHPASRPVVSTKGDLVVVETSALHDGTNFVELRKVLIQVAQQLPLQSDANAIPRGTVVESMQSVGRGPLIRVNLREGTLKRGQYFVAESILEGKVKDIRAMVGTSTPLMAGQQARHSGKAEDNNLSLESVGAGVTVDVMGCVALPNPGAEFMVASSYEQAKLMALVARNAIRYQDQVAEREQEMRFKKKRGELVGEEEEEEEEERNIPSHHQQQQQIRGAVPEQAAELEEADWDEDFISEEAQDIDVEADEDGEGEFDEVEEVDELDAEEEVDEEEMDELDRVDADEVPVDLDPRARVAPPLPPRSSWEISPPPPPTQRALPIANIRPQFKYYSLVADELPPPAEAGIPVLPQQPEGEKKFGLNVLIKTQNMGALRMLRSSIEDMNYVNAEKGLPEVHISYTLVGDITKKDLINAEAEGCWIYGFRIPRPSKPTIQMAKTRHIPVFHFRHHQHLLDHLQQHIEQSPTLTETGEAKLDKQFTTNRRSHPTVQ